MRLFLGRRLPLGFYGGISFNPKPCRHCGQPQPFSWGGFWFGVLIGLVGLFLLVRLVLR